MNRFLFFALFLFVLSCSGEKPDIYDYPDFEKQDSDLDDFVPADNDSVKPNDDADDKSDAEDIDIIDENDDDLIPDWESDICIPNPCVMENSDGVCVPEGDVFKCGCIEGYFWVQGECVADPCFDDPCKEVENSTGECVSSGKYYKCLCNEGYFFESGKCGLMPEIIFVKTNATGNNDGTSWENAFTDLTDALESVGEPTEKQWIWVAKGTYKPKKAMNIFDCETTLRCSNFAMKNNVSIICGFSGDESKVEQRDYIKNETIFSGDLDSNGLFSEGDSYHVFYNYNIDETAVIDGCIIEGGNADYGSGGTEETHKKHGGGMNNLNEVTATIRNSVFRNNKAFIAGGAIANSNNSAPLIENCIFEKNTAFRGGAIANSMSSPKIISSVFRNNSTNEGFGGAMLNNEESNTVIEDSIFENNTSNDGGAMVNLEFSHTKIIRSVFRNNTASRSGGAISAGYSSDTQITNSLFESNSGQMGGGAIEIYQESSLRVVNSKFFFNKVPQKDFYSGGALLVTSSSVQAVNSLFAGNESNSGGAIATQWSIVDLVNSTAVLNFAKGEHSYGGGMYNSGKNGEIYITNSIIYYNYAETGDNEIYNDLVVTEVSYSNIRGCLKSGYWDVDCGEDKEWNIDFDPLFNDINKGDFTLSADSPCIDSGDNSPFEVDGIAEGVLKDLLGNDRIINGKIDMGAYESEK